MKSLFTLIASPFALGRATIIAIAAGLVAKSGVWFDNDLFGEMAVFYSMAYGLSILAKGGGDAGFSRKVSEGNDLRVVLSEYVSAMRTRLLLALVPVAVFSIIYLDYGLPETISLSLLSLTIVYGNALRISTSPSFQLGYDNSTFAVIAILFGIWLGTPVWLSGLIIAACLGAVQIVVLSRQNVSYLALNTPARLISMPYMTSELSSFLLRFGTPSLMALLADMELVGSIRSVERLAFAGTFALFLINNRLFFDFARNATPLRSVADYFTRYSLPALLFFIAVLAALSAAALLGFIPNIAEHWPIFALYSLGYFASVACGPVSSTLNFLGKERFVFLSGLIGATSVLSSFRVAIWSQDPLMIVYGSVLGHIAVYSIQTIRLLHILGKHQEHGNQS